MSQLNQAQGEFLNNYYGDNKFILSLKAQYQRNATLTERQVKYLGTFIENMRLKGLPMNGIPVKGVPKAMTAEETPSLEIEENSLFSLEALEESAIESKPTETPMLSSIEETLRKIAGQVVEETMRKADAKASLILAKAEKLAAVNSKVMHIRVGNSEIKKLSNEAHPQLAQIISAMKLGKTCGKNVWLVGPTGSGKTTLGKQLSEALDLPFGHISFSAGCSETWLTGRQTPVGYISADFVDCFKNGGVFLGDEQDAADANLMVFLNSSLANGYFTNPMTGEKLVAHKDFYYVAAANTFGSGANAQYSGRVRLDAATLSRFVYFQIDYNEKLEAQLCVDSKLLKTLHKARAKLRDRNAQQVIGTREIIYVARAVEAGFTKNDAINSAFALTWPKGLAEEIGLLAKEEATEPALAF